MTAPAFTFELGDGATLHLQETQLSRLLDDLRIQGLMPTPVAEPTSPTRALGEDDPRWEDHSGGAANHIDPPEWDENTDLAPAVQVYSHLPPKTRAFHDLLVDNPGQMLSVDDICAAAPHLFNNHRSIAGCLNGYLKSCREVDRRFPFYWWAHTPTDYAMKPSVARLFAAARDRG